MREVQLDRGQVDQAGEGGAEARCVLRQAAPSDLEDVRTPQDVLEGPGDATDLGQPPEDDPAVVEGQLEEAALWGFVKPGGASHHSKGEEWASREGCLDLEEDQKQIFFKIKWKINTLLYTYIN